MHMYMYTSVVADYIRSVYHPSNGLDHAQGEAWCSFDPDSLPVGAVCKVSSLPPAAFGGTCVAPKKKKCQMQGQAPKIPKQRDQKCFKFFGGNSSFSNKQVA